MARRAISRIPAPKRQYIWSDVFTRLADSGMVSEKVSAGLSGLGLTTGGGVTLIRTRGQLTVHFDPANIDDVVLFGASLGVFSSDAFAIGQTALPGPVSDADYDWIYHRLVTLGPVFTATESGNDLMQNL